MSNRQMHNLIQGSDEWLLFRQSKFGASEAAAMLGLSKKVKRTELLHMKHTGTAKEFSDWVQENILDYGHEVEAMARPLIEALIDDDLYPVTCSDGDLSASCDGLTMSEEIAFEHKQWNASLATAVSAGVLPDEYMPQCQQIMLVTGASKVIFVVSDGTQDNFEHMEVLPDTAWFDRIRSGWAQFAKDLATYVPAVVEVKPLGRTPETLPALRLEVTGMVTSSNLADFKDHALAVFAGINRELTTDQEFADAEKTVKWCGEVESRLAAAKEHALSQTQSIDALFKTIDDISAEARSVRLELDKLVMRRKVEIKESIILKGKKAYDEHIAALKEETGGPWIVLPMPDFAAAAKNKRTMASIQDGIDTALANAKIAADASAKSIRANLACIREDGAGFDFLFSDKLALIAKPMDDLKLVIKTRITAHAAAEADKLEKERVKIAEEERIKAEKKVTEQLDALTPVIRAAVVETAPETAFVPRVVYAPRAVPTPNGSPTLRLGQINERLTPISLSAEGLASLGFAHSATDKAAKLYHESSFPLICAALIQHIESVLSEQKQPA